MGSKQIEASKRYWATEAGKLAQQRSTSKSQGKKFIKEFARLDELEEYRLLIEERIKEIRK